MVFVGLLLASDVLGTPLPEIVVQTAQSDGTAKALVKHVKQTLFQEPIAAAINAPQTKIAATAKMVVPPRVSSPTNRSCPVPQLSGYSNASRRLRVCRTSSP